MAFLCTFIGILVAGIAWAALFVGLLESGDAGLERLSAWFAPDSILGWLFFVGLSTALTWLLYRFLRTRLSQP